MDVICAPQPMHSAAPRMQRTRGVGRFGIRWDGVASRLDDLYQEGSASIRFPASSDDTTEAVLINIGGGLAGGDRFIWDVDVGDSSRSRVVTQACERAYRSTGEAARVEVSLRVGDGAELEWLPQETILFDQSRLERSFEIDIEPMGRLLAVEAVILGRTAMGETASGARLKDRWRVRRGERLVFADNLTLGDLPSTRHRPALLGGAGAFASILLVAPDAETHLAGVRAVLGQESGASAIAGRLFCRILAKDGMALRRELLPVLAALRRGAPPPRLWTV